MQETIKRICVQKPSKSPQLYFKAHVMINHNPKLLFNCSYYNKLSGYVYDNFR